MVDPWKNPNKWVARHNLRLVLLDKCLNGMVQGYKHLCQLVYTKVTQIIGIVLAIHAILGDMHPPYEMLHNHLV